MIGSERSGQTATTVTVGHDWLDPIEMMRRTTAVWSMISGSVGIVAGALVLAPNLSPSAVTIIVAFHLIIVGASMVFFTLRDREDVAFWWARTAMGAMLIVGGSVVGSLAGRGAEPIATMLGVVLVAAGSTEATLTTVVRSMLPPWRLLLIGGLVTALAGLVVVAWPDMTPRTLGTVVGSALLIEGISSIVAGARLRRIADGEHEPAPESPAAEDVEVIDLRDRAISTDRRRRAVR